MGRFERFLGAVIGVVSFSVALEAMDVISLSPCERSLKVLSRFVKGDGRVIVGSPSQLAMALGQAGLGSDQVKRFEDNLEELLLRLRRAPILGSALRQVFDSPDSKVGIRFCVLSEGCQLKDAVVNGEPKLVFASLDPGLPANISSFPFPPNLSLINLQEGPLEVGNVEPTVFLTLPPSLDVYDQDVSMERLWYGQLFSNIRRAVDLQNLVRWIKRNHLAYLEQKKVDPYFLPHILVGGGKVIVDARFLGVLFVLRLGLTFREVEKVFVTHLERSHEDPQEILWELEEQEKAVLFETLSQLGQEVLDYFEIRKSDPLVLGIELGRLLAKDSD